MAEPVDKFEFRRSNNKYPWQEWLDGRIWKATLGEDFHITPESFKASVYNAAQARGKKARCAIEGDSVIFQAILRDENGAP